MTEKKSWDKIRACREKLKEKRKEKTYERHSQAKIVFYSIQYRNDCLDASDLFHMFTQSIKLYIFYYHIFKQLFKL